MNILNEVLIKWEHFDSSWHRKRQNKDVDNSEGQCWSSEGKQRKTAPYHIAVVLFIIFQDIWEKYTSHPKHKPKQLYLDSSYESNISFQANQLPPLETKKSHTHNIKSHFALQLMDFVALCYFIAYMFQIMSELSRSLQKWFDSTCGHYSCKKKHWPTWKPPSVAKEE